LCPAAIASAAGCRMLQRMSIAKRQHNDTIPKNTKSTKKLLTKTESLRNNRFKKIKKKKLAKM
jgi:hypothetical protein